MDDPAIDALPRAYRLGLRLRALGADDELIAECLDIEPESIVTLLDIGTAKLERIQRGDQAVDWAEGARGRGDGGPTR